MTRLLVSFALIAAMGPAGARPQAPVERSPGSLLIDAVALDRKDVPVMDLRQEEVEVWIGHYRVPIGTFTAVTPTTDERSGRLIVLVLDDMTLPLTSVPRAREVARRFVNKMSPGDRMAIVMVNGASMESTDDRSRLLRAIDTYDVRLTGVMRIEQLGQHVLKTVGALSRQMAEAPEQRKTIVAIGRAGLFDTPLPPPETGADLRREWIDAMRATASANVNFYVIDPAGVGMGRVDGGARGFARETGGYTFANTNDLNGAADRIMREAGNYYLIGVGDPPNGRNADLRELDVRVLRRGVSIRARRAVIGGR